MQIVGLVNGNSNNADFQFQTAPSSLLNQGTIAGLAVTTNQVGVGSALISVTSNGQTWLITYHNTSVVTIDTSGTKKVWIDVTQSKIDNGVANNEDGTGIAQINTGASYPGSGSYIPLASITGGVITDDRVFVSMKNVKRKGMTAHRLIYIDASGNEQELPYGTAGQVLTAVNGTTTPIWSSQGVDIAGLPKKTAPVGADTTIISDSEDGGVNKKIDVASLFSPFGNGSDGDVTISTNTTLVRDMYYRNLTINSTIVLNPNGYRIYVAGTLTNNGIIRRNGNPGNNSTSQTGGLAGATLNQGSLNAESAAGNGSDSGNGLAGASSNPSYTTINGVPGGGNQSYLGGAGGTSVRGALYNIAYSTRDIVRMLSVPSSYPSTVVSTQYKGPSGSGGGAGQSHVGGGGAGSNGGAIWIAARIYSGASGTIEAIGGIGGSGWSYASYGGGGGGGGQGGLVVLIYETLIAIGTVTLTGGVGGASGGGLGGSVNGANGNAGVVIQIPITL